MHGRQHEIVCRCGSLTVLIETTRTRQRPLPGRARLLIRRQYCRCGVCGRRWVRRLKIHEELVDEYQVGPN